MSGRVAVSLSTMATWTSTPATSTATLLTTYACHFWKVHGPHGATICGRSDCCLCSHHTQGGGVFVYNGTVNSNSCNIYNNTATYSVRLPPLETPWTPWSYQMRKVSDCCMFASCMDRALCACHLWKLHGPHGATICGRCLTVARFSSCAGGRSPSEWWRCQLRLLQHPRQHC